MDKFSRNYKLIIETVNGDFVTIEPPFTIDFDIQRDTLASVNIANIRIFNLSERNRNLIRKDAWKYDDRRIIELKAGYGNNLSTVAIGSIAQAWSTREGTDFITSIESFDAGWAFNSSKSNLHFIKGTAKRTIIESLAKNMNSFGVKVGAIGDFPGTIPRGNSYSGSTSELLKEVSGDSFFVDNNKINVLNSDEAIESPILNIKSSSGLLGTPIRENTYLRFDMLFEPKIQVGQVVNLESITGANFNGSHKVYSLKHKGMISASVGGSVITTVGLLDGNFKPIRSSLDAS